MDVRAWLRRLRREHDQTTVELAEDVHLARDEDIRAAEERIEEHSEHDPPSPPHEPPRSG